MKVYDQQEALRSKLQPLIQAEQWNIIADGISKSQKIPLVFTGPELESVCEMSDSQKQVHKFML